MRDDDVILLRLCRSLRGGLGHEVRMSGFSVQLAIDLDQGCSVCPCLPKLLLRQSACSVGTVCAIVWPLQRRVRLRPSAWAVSGLDQGCSICPCLQKLTLSNPELLETVSLQCKNCSCHCREDADGLLCCAFCGCSCRCATNA